MNDNIYFRNRSSRQLRDFLNVTSQFWQVHILHIMFSSKISRRSITLILFLVCTAAWLCFKNLRTTKSTNLKLLRKVKYPINMAILFYTTPNLNNNQFHLTHLILIHILVNILKYLNHVFIFNIRMRILIYEYIDLFELLL